MEPMQLTDELWLVQKHDSLWCLQEDEVIRASIGRERDNTFNWKVLASEVDAKMKNVDLSGSKCEMLTGAAYQAIRSLVALGIVKTKGRTADSLRTPEFELVIRGFTSLAQMQAFWEWYENAGEARLTYWFEDGQNEIEIDVVSMPAVDDEKDVVESILPLVNLTQLRVAVKPE